MGEIAESRSKETGNHVKRVALYSELFALYYGLENKEAEMLKQASPMHDIGKVGIPDNILLKPGALSAAEFTLMKEHAKLGADALIDCMQESECNVEINFLSTAIDIAHYHHEKWNGQGYPNGLSGDNIPLSARLMALADVFDALISRRCYKDPVTFEDSVNIILDGLNVQTVF